MGLTAKKALGASKKYTDDQIAQIPGDTVVDVVEDGNMNPVTSNAVYDEAQEIKLSISDLSASVLHTSGNETATGVKTFSSGINSSKGIVGPKASGESDPHVPLELRGSDTEAWLLFSSRLGSGLGYFGTKSDNKPYFYNTQEQRLVMASEVGTASAKNSTNAVTQGSTDLVESGAVYTAIQQSGGGADLTIIAPEFNTATAYSVGDYVIYNGSLYRFTSAHSAGAWNSSQVVEIKAVGQYVTAGKKSGTTLGVYATAEGDSTTASGDCSHAEGYTTTASGYYSHAEGYGPTASGYCSHAEGQNSTASGNYSHAEGNTTTASGDYSHAEGYSTTASGKNSHVEGQNSTASGNYSHAGGYNTIAQRKSQTTIGEYNVLDTTGTSGGARGSYVFIIGKGDGSARSNAFSVSWTGEVKAASTITASTTADYAEYFEWVDGNPNAEDRVGHFVTFDNANKIRIANDKDEYILGIVSGEPFVLGNGDCDVWNGMFMRDKFNRVMYEPAPLLDDDGNQVKDDNGNPVYQGTRPIINPDYDNTKQYINRADRPEWEAIGMLGVLAVVEDGTCEINSYCTINKDGIATKANKDSINKYRVINRKSEDVIEVVFK